MPINYLIAQGREAPDIDWMKAKKNALTLSQAEREYTDYPEEKNWLREQRGMIKTRFGQDQEDRMRELAKRPFKDHWEALTTLVEEAPMISYDQYDSSKAWFERHGIRKDLLPPKDYFERNAPAGVSPEEFYENWKSQNITTAKKMLDEYKAGTERIKAVKEKEESRPEVVKLIDQLNKMDKKDPNRPFIEGRLKKLAESEGFSIEVDKDGNVRIVQGAIGAGGMTKPMQTKVQEKLFNAKEQESRLKEIEDMFKPEYQQIATRGKAWWSGVKAKLGSDLSKDEKANLTDFSAYKRRAISNINLHIKEITGAQMSEAEADRLRQDTPDPGEGIFGGDDPVSFKAKMDDVLKEVRASIKRYEKLLKDGFTPEEINKMAKADTLPDISKFYPKGSEKRNIDKVLKDTIVKSIKSFGTKGHTKEEIKEFLDTSKVLKENGLSSKDFEEYLK